jgi:formylglycine-generating enzyme required for sulfatase activity
MGVYLVTQAQYAKVIGGKSPSFFKDSPDHPVEQVPWSDRNKQPSSALTFCKKLSELPEEKKAGRNYRLPTEAEWEYACRAGTTTVYNCGDALSSKQANFNGIFPYGGAPKGPNLKKTAQVGSYPPNAWGLYDMHGNVWQWCSDWYDPDYYKKSPKEDPKGPAEGVVNTGFENQYFVVVRGGCWLDEARGCRAAFRFRFQPIEAYRLVGFRVVCDVTGGQQ